MLEYALPWFISAATITTMILAGNGWRWAWVLGILTQCLWAWYILVTGQFGFLPMLIVMVTVYLRNHTSYNRSLRDIIDNT